MPRPTGGPTQVAAAGRLIGPVGPHQPGAQLRHGLGEATTGPALVGQDDQAWPQYLLAGGPVQPALGDLPLAQLGLARHQAVGMASGQASTYSLRPQYQREWLRSDPSPAQPASSERLTVSRLWPHGIGVASSSRHWSHHDGEATAKARRMLATRGAARRSRRCRPPARTPTGTGAPGGD